MQTLWRDLRYSVRMLLKQPGFAVIAVLTLALGIGANTAMFSVLNTYLFRALPYPNSAQLMRVYRTSIHSQSWPHSPASFMDQREKNTVFERMVAFNGISPNLAEEGEAAERLQGMAVTADFFPALGVPAALGRVFTAAEDQPGASQVVVLSDRFWQRRFGADPNIVGRTLRLDGENIKVVGVMPPGFDHPLLWDTVDVWRPLAFAADQRQNRGNNFLRLFARLKPGVSLAQAQAAMNVLAANQAQEHQENRNEGLRLEPLQRSVSDDIGRKVMWFVFGLAGFVLLIACANLANLQLVRTAGRAKELAVRMALGAGRWRLLRQSLTESLVISLLGGALSLLFAVQGVDFISQRLFSELPGAAVTLDYRVFGFALLCSVLTGLLFGVVPAWLASRTNVNEALKDNLRGSSAGRGQHRLRHALIIGEVAFALVLLAGAGLFLRGLYRFTKHDPGWQVDGLLTAQIGLRGANYAKPPQRLAFYQQLEERLRALPGVEQVALSNSNPVWGFNSSGSFRIEGQPVPQAGQWPEIYFEPVSTDYFNTLGVRLSAGRTFTAADTSDKAPVIIINETTARRFWPNESAIGKRLGRPGDNPNWHEVVGVVNDMAFPADLSEPYTRFQGFRPLTQSQTNSVVITLRSTTPPEALVNTLRAAVAQLDPAQPVHRLRTARSLVEQGLGSIALLSTLLAAFAALGLALAAIGIYGVISYTVAQRTGEIGIRLALGAQSKDVLWLVLGKGGRLILLGALLGIAGALAEARLLAAAIPTLPTRDPLTLALITCALVLVAFLACYLPARRATKVDPLIALRYE
ncbi:MAG: ABC transporter permease [Acidobacteria bacterium]|nr:ABC transporter permease [Acidobacteriota bacterium]MBI3426667.1 ABC transporter permease [Acidobacteriota bacterium]